MSTYRKRGCDFSEKSSGDKADGTIIRQHEHCEPLTEYLENFLVLDVFQQIMATFYLRTTRFVQRELMLKIRNRM